MRGFRPAFRVPHEANRGTDAKTFESLIRLAIREYSLGLLGLLMYVGLAALAIPHPNSGKARNGFLSFLFISVLTKWVAGGVLLLAGVIPPYLFGVFYFPSPTNLIINFISDIFFFGVLAMIGFAVRYGTKTWSLGQRIPESASQGPYP